MLRSTEYGAEEKLEWRKGKGSCAVMDAMLAVSGVTSRSLAKTKKRQGRVQSMLSTEYKVEKEYLWEYVGVLAIGVALVCTTKYEYSVYYSVLRPPSSFVYTPSSDASDDVEDDGVAFA